MERIAYLHVRVCDLCCAYLRFPTFQTSPTWACVFSEISRYGNPTARSNPPINSVHLHVPPIDLAPADGITDGRSDAFDRLTDLTRNAHRTQGPANDTGKDSTADKHTALTRSRNVTNWTEYSNPGCRSRGRWPWRFNTHTCTGLQYA